MKLRKIAVTVSLAAIGLSAALTAPATFAAEEQFFPVLSFRTGAYAPNGTPWANGYVDYFKLTNARGGVNGVKMIWEECETAYATDRGVECYERLKGKHGGATVVQPLSTGITFALTEKAPMMTCTAHPMLGMPALPYWKLSAMATMTRRPKNMAMSTMSLFVPSIAVGSELSIPSAMFAYITFRPPSSRVP